MHAKKQLNLEKEGDTLFQFMKFDSLFHGIQFQEHKHVRYDPKSRYKTLKLRNVLSLAKTKVFTL